MATTFTFLKTVSMTGVATTASSTLLTVAASAVGSWGVAIGATLTHANLSPGTTIVGYNSSTQAVLSTPALTTGSALTVVATNPTTINISDVAGVLKTGGDIYNISGPKFVIDQDSLFGLNEINSSATAASTLGNITLSATLGGDLEIDARYMRMIPFTGGSGTLTPGSLIDCGGATGIAVAVYSSLTAEPVYTGAASGWIKVKQWNGVPFPTSGSFTQAGYTFSTNGADSDGFMFLLGDEGSTISVNRRNICTIHGGYYALGVTGGARTETFQLPTHGKAVDIASIEVETSPGSGSYESYVCANTVLATATAMATDWRGKVFWLNRTAGVVRFGHDGTNQTGGYLPPAGCNVRAYNIFTVNVLPAARRTHAVPNATIATRYDFTTTGGGVVITDKVNLAWYPSFSQAYAATMTNTSVCDAMLVAELATKWVPSNVVVAPGPTTTVQQALTATMLPAGIDFTDCMFVRLSASSAGNYACTITDVGDVTMTRTKSFCLVAHGNATSGSYNVTRVKSWTQNVGCVLQRGLFSQMANLKIYSPIVYDHPATSTATTLGRSGISLSYVTDFLIDGWDNGGLNCCQPYASLVDLGGGCRRGVIQNFGGGTPDPLHLGGATMRHGLAWTRSTTTATVTHPAHGLITGLAVNVPISSDVAAITVGQKTITVTGVNTYTFTCLNAGAASGTLSARQAVCAAPVTTASGGACSDIFIRRIYFDGARGAALSTGDNSNTNYIVRNVYDTDFFNSGNFQMKNSVMTGTSWVGTTTGVVGQYGSHWLDYFLYPQPGVTGGLTYTRTTTTATVTHENHGLYTGAVIILTSRSDAATIPSLGAKTITVLTKDTYRFTVANAGAASGTISFDVPNSKLSLAFNEPSAATLPLVTFTAGSPAFTSAGTCLLENIGEAIEIVSHEYVRGFSGIPQAVPVMTGGTLANFNCIYDIDTGNGYTGSYKNLSQSIVVSGTSGQYTLTMADTSLVFVGDAVYGANIAGLAVVASIDSSSQVTLNLPHTGSIVSAVCQFVSIHNEVISPTTGVKMKWRFTRRAAGTDAITFMTLWMRSTLSDMQLQYPLPGKKLTFTNLVPGTDVVVISSGSTTVLASVDANPATTWVYEYVDEQFVDIGFLNPGYVPQYIRWYLLGPADATLPVYQTIDRNYQP